MATVASIAQAWREHAYELVQWTLQRLVNCSDTYGHYPDRGPADPCVLPEPVKGSLTERRLARHYGATTRGHIVAVHALSPQQTAKWLLIGFRCTGEGTAATPGVNFDIALQWYERLRTLGFDPILEDGDGQGGYRLITLFDEPVAATAVHTFGQQVTVDYADKGLTQPPRIVPGSVADEHWCRLPGLHPRGEHASRIWDGDRWLEGAEAVAALLHARATPPTFLRTPRANTMPPVMPPREPGRPVVAPKAVSMEVTRKRSGRTAMGDTAILPGVAVSRRAAPLEKKTMIATMKSEPIHTPAAAAPEPSDDAAIVATIAARTGMRESEIHRRLFAWFSDQDEVVQALVLGQIPQALRPTAQQLLAQQLATT